MPLYRAGPRRGTSGTSSHMAVGLHALHRQLAEDCARAIATPTDSAAHEQDGGLAPSDDPVGSDSLLQPLGGEPLPAPPGATRDRAPGLQRAPVGRRLRRTNRCSTLARRQEQRGDRTGAKRARRTPAALAPAIASHSPARSPASIASRITRALTYSTSTGWPATAPRTLLSHTLSHHGVLPFKMASLFTSWSWVDLIERRTKTQMGSGWRAVPEAWLRTPRLRRAPHLVPARYATPD